MKRVLLALFACGPAIAPAAAQTPSAPTLVFTIHGGVAGGHSLWAVPKQPVCNTGTGGTCSGTSYDTLRIARTVGSGITAGLSIAYFPGARFGYYGEIAFVGVSLDDACAGVYLSGGPGSTHDLLCQAVAGSSITLGATSFIGGITIRAAPGSSLSPYAALGGGALLISQSTLDMSGDVATSGGVANIPIVVDNSPRHFSPVFAIGAGLRMSAGPGYGVRIALEDLIARFQRLTGPVNALGQGPVASRFYHHVVVRLGFDIVLEKKRGRRY